MAAGGKASVVVEPSKQPAWDSFFDPFSPAQRAAEDAVDAICSKGGKLLYDKYIHRLSFPFAATTASQQLVSELMMVYVRCDLGEAHHSASPLVPEQLGELPLDCGDDAGAGEPESEQDSWSLEPEPRRNTIDNWARTVVPVKKKIVVKEVPEEAQRKSSRRRPSIPGSSRGSRAPSRTGTTAGSGGFGVPTVSAERLQSAGPPAVIRLHEQREDVDEENTHIREAKDREYKRKMEEEAKERKRAAAKMQEKEELAQVQQQMSTKPYTHDSNGNIIWIQDVQVSQLPSLVANTGYTLPRDKGSKGDTRDLSDTSKEKLSATSKSVTSARPLPPVQPKKLGEAGERARHSDSFKKGASTVQPSLFETMELSAGVALSNRSGKHKGRPPSQEAGGKMSRKEYEDLVRLTGGVSGYPEEPLSQPDKPPERQLSGGSGGSRRDPPQQMQQVLPTEGSKRLDSKEDLGPELVPRPPDKPRTPMQPAPPHSARRLNSMRERMQKGTGSRYPNCAPQPPLGATMGHGLVKSRDGDIDEEFYFPPGTPGAGSRRNPSVLDERPSTREAAFPRRELLSARGRSSLEGSSPLGTPRDIHTPGGSIVSKKPDFVHRYFPPKTAP
jgi:hypothetical protein